MIARQKKFNKPETKSFRKFLRNNSTSAETTLWNILKNKGIEGYKFRRQHSIGSYIVDFCCPRKKIVIELDGNVHSEYHQIEYDIRRDKYISDQGFRILRFENRIVFEDPEYIIEKINPAKSHNNNIIIHNHPVAVKKPII